MRWNRVILTISGLLLSTVLCSSVHADPVWLCSIEEAVQVDEDGTIGPPDLGNLDTPTFFRVDAGEKAITLLAPESRKGEVTRIDSIHQSPGMWVFSGVEEGRSWSMVISVTGQMTLSVTGDGATWAVFGHALKTDE